MSQTTKKTTKQIGDELAQQMGAPDAATFISDTQAKLKSASTVTQQNGKAAAIDFTSRLLNLVLYQEIDTNYNLNKYDWINKFDDQRIEVGEGKEFIKNLMTGIDTYDKNKFVPDAATPPSADAKTIRLYKTNANGQKVLNKYAFKALKPLTIQENEWFSYFMSGKLMEFVNKQIELMKQSLFLYKYHVFTQFFTDLINDTQDITDLDKTGIISKRINGTSTNILSCFVNEIFPIIEEMQYLNNEYARDTNKNNEYPNINNREDLLLIMNRNTLNKFKNGALSNQLNNKLVDFNNVLPLDNIIGVGKNLNVGNSTENITVGTTELVPTNKVIIINKNLIKYLWFIEVSNSQYFVQNMSMQYVFHLWGIFDQLDWEGAAVYKNDHLETLPVTTR